MDLYQSFIHKTRYARWDYGKERRENWDETVDRLVTYLRGIFSDKVKDSSVFDDIYRAIYSLDVMPSMRLLYTAGDAHRRENVCGYNCSYMKIDDIRAFGEATYLLMNGTGLGFSVERQYICELPNVPSMLVEDQSPIYVEDSKEGWASAICELIYDLYKGKIRKLDVSNVRPKGSILKTFGGRSSGPGPLLELVQFIVDTFKGALGRKLESIECHDILCKTGEIIVVGGVRRCLPGDAMVHCKHGMIPIKDVNVGDEVLTYDGYCKVTNKFEQGKQSVYKIITEDGEFICTPNHRMAVHDNTCDKHTYVWKETCSLVEGDKLILVDKDIEGDNNVCTPTDFKPTFDGYVFLGMITIVGVNPICDHRIRTIPISLKIVEMLKGYLTSIGCWVTIEDYDDEGDDRKYILSCDKLSFDLPAGQVPDYVFRSRRNYRLAFIIGVTMCSNVQVSKSLAKDIQNLMYSCHINYALSEIGFDINSLNHIVENTNRYSKVLKVVYEGDIVDTYDIEVSGRHEFYCNGYLTHNSALISLSNLSDNRMRVAKSGSWWEVAPHRRLANNSVAYTEKPEIDNFMEEWLSLYRSNSGERGIFNRVAAQKHAEKYGRRDHTKISGVNPCSEISLRSCQFCNLTEVIIRPSDDEETLLRKVELATIIGTFQASFTNFMFLRDEWRKNTEEEALLGVSLTGIFDNRLLFEDQQNVSTLLCKLRERSVQVNKVWSAMIGIRQATAITCVKPSGTVSQLCNCASGIHPRYARYYIRRVRASIIDPVCKLMKEYGVPVEIDFYDPNTCVFSFPIKAPDGALLKEDIKAVDHLKMWMLYYQNYAEHQVSVTVSIQQHEWISVSDFVYSNFENIGGLSFLPYSKHVYKQAPYEEIDEDTYLKLAKKMPVSIDWDKLREYEKEDYTSAKFELACTGDNCEL